MAPEKNRGRLRGENSHRRACRAATQRTGLTAFARGRSQHARAPIVSGPDRLAAEAEEVDSVCRRSGRPTPTGDWSSGCWPRPHYGKHMAIGWLDVVRFADTIGYHSDTPRNVWPYRDYVIGAFNANKPFDRFTLEQFGRRSAARRLAWIKSVASCFQSAPAFGPKKATRPRTMKRGCWETGCGRSAPSWLGQTVGCCQCHDHKFDPFKTRDFYSLRGILCRRSRADRRPPRRRNECADPRTGDRTRPADRRGGTQTTSPRC